MTAKLAKGASELGNQIARLMAALTKAGQGNSPGRTLNSPRHTGHWRGAQAELLLVAPIHTMAKLVWNRLLQLAVYLLIMEHQP